MVQLFLLMFYCVLERVFDVSKSALSQAFLKSRECFIYGWDGMDGMGWMDGMGRGIKSVLQYSSYFVGV